MKTKKAINPKEEEAKKLHLPAFFVCYSLFVCVMIIVTFLILMLTLSLSEMKDENIMLQAVLIVQLGGIGYFLPFYFLPQFLCISKYDAHRRLNIALLIINSILFSLFYPLFRIIVG